MAYIDVGIGYYLPNRRGTDPRSGLLAQSAYLVLDDGKQVELNRQCKWTTTG
ncbi:MAG: hypothetical protein ACLU4J_14985 [Butyricimonas paravirosa]